MLNYQRVHVTADLLWILISLTDDDVDDGWNSESTVDQIGLVEKSERPRAVAGDAQKPPTKPHIMQKLFSMDWFWGKLCRKTMFFTLI